VDNSVVADFSQSLPDSITAVTGTMNIHQIVTVKWRHIYYQDVMVDFAALVMAFRNVSLAMP